VSATVLYMSMSLDGFIAGPNAGLGNGLGDGGDRLHEWSFNGQQPIFGQVYDEFMATGAIVAGRGTFEPADGWGGYARNPEQLLVAQETWEQDKADFRTVALQFAPDRDAMRVIAAAQKNIRKARDQAAHAGIAVARIYHARRRIGLFLREMYEGREERPRLERVAVRPTRRAGDGGGNGKGQGDQGPADAQGADGRALAARGKEKEEP